MLPFARKLEYLGYPDLKAESVNILQVNLGWRCNQACKHCHLLAGPQRPEQMTKDTIDEIIEVVRRWSIPTVDLTGGAPELNPHYEYLVERLDQEGTHILTRCNLTILLEPGKEHLPEFFRDHRVELVCSLPYYQEDPVDRLRGAGVFQKSLEALRRLNRLGYGESPDLRLNLMYNPAGAFLPPAEGPLEEVFRRELLGRHQIRFHRLFTLLNMPIGRFKEFLKRSKIYERYMRMLVSGFNPATLAGLMCRSLLSVAWDGRLFDCDFNQALDLPLSTGLPQTIGEFDLDALGRRPIRLGDHCYGCTAGLGSSCGGKLAEG
ncbi:MAG: arsenosugar biosynthesis radical SAM protein ArsS [Syntrophobacterales bacterium]|jgi:radical SAM/Cys-rich protein|nr:arsenosugar biosynthesis radical SAM protein ArsS [Syntrophobacterales bacterium]